MLKKVVFPGLSLHLSLSLGPAILGLLVLRCLVPLWVHLNFRMDHLFVLRAFFYTESSLYGPLTQQNVVVVLLNMERHLLAKSLDAECTLDDSSRYPAKLEAVHLSYSHAPCRLGIFRLVCQLANGLPSSEGLPPNIGLIFRDSAPIKIPLVPADEKYRKLLLCPGRMFLFEQWHLLMAAMEANRLLGADLVIAHIQSVLPSLLPLLRLYEEDGLLQTRPSLRMPTADSLPFDPNEETLWNSQLVNFQECLYEFKESAEFIGFPDWDDLLIGTGPAAPFANELLKFAQANPKVAAFLPKRFLGRIINLEELWKWGGTVEDLFLGGIQFSIWPYDEEFISKVFVRPRFVSAVDLHGAGQMTDWNSTQMELPQEIAFWVHARDFQNDRISTTLPSAPELLESAQRLLARHNFSLQTLPRSEHFLPRLNSCLRRQHIEGRVRVSKHSKCFNYAQCRPMGLALRADGPCWSAANLWDSFSMPARQLRIFVLSKGRLALESNCQI